MSRRNRDRYATAYTVLAAADTPEAAALRGILAIHAPDVNDCCTAAVRMGCAVVWPCEEARRVLAATESRETEA